MISAKTCSDVPLLMRNTIFALMWIACPISVAAQVPASPNDGSGDIVISAWADPETCNIQNATAMNVKEALSRADSLVGQCIAVDGYWSGRAVFSSASDGNQRRSNSVAALSSQRIGVYGTERMLYIAPRKARRYKLVGIFGRCETEWPGAMMVMGYCHYTSGPILKLSQAVRAR